MNIQNGYMTISSYVDSLIIANIRLNIERKVLLFTRKYEEFLLIIMIILKVTINLRRTTDKLYKGVEKLDILQSIVTAAPYMMQILKTK